MNPYDPYGRGPKLDPVTVFITAIIGFMLIMVAAAVFGGGQ